MKVYCILILCLISFTSCSNDDNDDSTPSNLFTDTRDNQTYKLITLGSQTWFSQNLNFELENGESKCYSDNLGNCFTYGRLYRGDDALTACPEGFHLPSREEWEELFDFLGGENVAHFFLGPYSEQQGEAINFDLLAGGYYHGSYQQITEVGRYWTSTPTGLPDSNWYLQFEPEISTNFGGASYGILMNCRCIKD